MDDDGFLFINGRKKNIFITSFGRNVSPEWVESSLLNSPYILLQACVFLR
jgi:long-subunit acyl-CoA synthetase (AMP-forming)